MWVSQRRYLFECDANTLENRVTELQGAGLDEDLPEAILGCGTSLPEDVLWQIAVCDRDADDRIAGLLERLALLKRDWPVISSTRALDTRDSLARNAQH